MTPATRTDGTGPPPGVPSRFALRVGRSRRCPPPTAPTPRAQPGTWTWRPSMGVGRKKRISPVGRQGGLQPLLCGPEHPLAHEGDPCEEGQAAQHPTLPERIGPVAHGHQGEPEHGDAVDGPPRPIHPGGSSAAAARAAAAAIREGGAAGWRWQRRSPSSRGRPPRSPHGAGARRRRPLHRAGDAWATCCPMSLEPG